MSICINNRNDKICKALKNKKQKDKVIQLEYKFSVLIKFQFDK